MPYDSGLAFCAHLDAHRAAMSVSADYLVLGGPGSRASGEAWLSGTVFGGRRAIRLSVSNWQTSEDDIARALAAFRAAAA